MQHEKQICTLRHKAVQSISKIATQRQKLWFSKGICQYVRLEAGKSLHYYACRTQIGLHSAPGVFCQNWQNNLETVY
jgi:hypothetical protein